MASRVTDSDGGALLLLKPNGQVRLERLHCQDSRWSQDVRKAMETATRQVMASLPPVNPGEAITFPPGVIATLDRQVSHHLKL